MSKNTRLQNLLIQRDAIRSEIDKSRDSIGIEPLFKRQSDAASSIALVTAPPKQRVVSAALDYGKTLAKKRAGGAVYLHTEGRALYERLLADVRRDDRAVGTCRLQDGERCEVMRRLEQMPGGGPVKLARATSIKLIAPIQKFMAGDLRMVRGYASTNDLDRQNDIVVASGMQTPRLPLPLLWSHDASQPIGSVRSTEIRSNGIWIEASLVAGIQRADETWALIEAGAIDSFSIGFRGLKSEPLPGGGLKYSQWDLYEVSVVSVPANPGAKIRRSM